MTSDGSQAGASEQSSGAPVAIEVRDVYKRYGNVQALDGVSLKVRSGTVHALVGENGSGKSTLMKIIAGIVKPDDGHITVQGEELQDFDARTTLARGVRVIYQDLALFPNMTVAENLGFVGDQPMMRPIRRKEVEAHAKRALSDLNLNIDPKSRLGDLSTAERQLVAIARTVSSNGQIIIMDEPTAALTQREIEILLETVRKLSDEGLSFIFISHKLREVTSIADEITVIRDGALVASGPANEYDAQRISHLMTGEEVKSSHSISKVRETEEPIVEVRDLTLKSSFHNIDLKLHAGRILGLAGLVGSGRVEIGLAIAGLIRPGNGQIFFRGKARASLQDDPRLQYVPEDRLTEGLFLEWSIADNIVVNSLKATINKFRSVSLTKIKEIGRLWRTQLAIKTPDVLNPALSLSGGNQQRVLLARALAPAPEVIILNNPTVGVDVGSRAEIHQIVRDIASEGTAVLVISDEAAELLSICDDLTFIHEGRIVGHSSTSGLSETQLVDSISRGVPV